MRRTLTAFALACAILPLRADTIKWNGGSGDVNTAGNWTPALVPGPSDIANIKSGTATMAADFSVSELKIACDWVSTGATD